VPNLHLMALNVTGGPLEFDAVVNIDEGLKNVNKLGDAFNSIGDKTKKNTFIDSFVQSLKENIKSLGTQVTDIKSKIKELESQPIGKQDFQGIKNLNDQLKQTETAVQFLTQLTDNLGELPKSFNESTTGAGRLQTQLRVLRDDLAKLKVEGKDASPEFASKLEEATHLEHALHNVNKELELQASNVAGVEA
jgi:chromosome segregation ATPase